MLFIINSIPLAGEAEDVGLQTDGSLQSITFICKPPGAQKGSAGDVGHLFIINLVGRVRRAMIVGVSLGVIPHNGYSVFCEISIVAAACGVVPRTVIGDKGETAHLHILFQPIAEERIRGSVEIGEMLGVIYRATAYHIKVDIGRNMR